MTIKRIVAPNLILGRGPCPRRTLELGAEVPAPRIEGFFSYKLIDARTGLVKQQGEMKNLVLDSGLNELGNGTTIGSLTSACQVGTGSTAPAVGQTGLVTPASPVITRYTTGDGATSSGPSFAYWYRRRVFLFIEAEANGNLTEIGVCNPGGTVFWARQLFKDGGGVPTVVVKTAGDQLQITYEYRVYPPTVDVTGTVTISAVNYDYTVRASRIDSGVWGVAGMLGALGSFTGTWRAWETQVLGSTTSNPGGSPADSDSYLNSAYVGSTNRLDATAKWEPPNANFATGIGSLGLWHFAGLTLFQLSFDSGKVPKDNTKRFTFVGRHSWARYP